MALNLNDSLLVNNNNNNNNSKIHLILEDEKRKLLYSSSSSFPIVDKAEDGDNLSMMTEREKWTRIEQEDEEDFHPAYQFDNTVWNLQEDNDGTDELLASIEDVSISTEQNKVTVEEQVLSQRLSQLSTSIIGTTSHDGDNDHDDDDYEFITTEHGKRRRISVYDTTTKSIVKKFRTTIHDRDEDQDPVIPTYLLPSVPLFKEIITQVLDHPNDDDFEELRQMAFFIHQRIQYDLLHQLWFAYFQSGTGQLKTKFSESEPIVVSDVDRRYWPKAVTSLVQLPPSESKQQEQVTNENAVQQRLNKYQQKINYYQRQFDEKKQQLIHIWTSVLEETIETFIKQYGLFISIMKYQTKIALLLHEYQDELLYRQYQQQQPTVYQKNMAQLLYNLEFELQTVKYSLIENEERLIYNQPSLAYDTFDISFPSKLHDLTDQSLQQQLLYQHQKLIQTTKTDLIAVSILAQQTMIDQLQKKFNFHLDEMYKNDHQHVSNKQMPKIFKQSIHQRSSNMHQYLKLKHEFIMNYYIHHSYHNLEHRINQDLRKVSGPTSPPPRIGFLPSLIIDQTIPNNISYQLNLSQLQLLKRGPTYVAPGQLHTSSQFQKNNSDIICKQFTPLKHKLAMVFDKFHVSINAASNFQKDAYEAFKENFSMVLPTDLDQRARYEKQLIQSIQHVLNKYQLCLRRTTDQNNLFYLTSKQHLTTRSNQYMERYTQYYQLFLDANNSETVREQLHKKYQAINLELEKLFKEKRLKTHVHQRLRLKLNRIKLPYLYFLPDISIMDASLLQLKPMIVAKHSATSNIAQYLYQLIRPLFIKFMNETTFINEADWIDRLHTHIYKEKHFSSTTLFVTLQISNFHTMASHQMLVDGLNYFLTENLVTPRLQYTSLITLNQNQWITIDTIKKLTELYLENNFFYYDGKIYRLNQSTGPTSFFFSDLLADIYLYLYDRLILRELKKTTEFYGRYKNQVFFTWTRSSEELRIFLDDLQKTYSNIHMEISFGQRVHYFNAQIENRQGDLYTSVYHDGNMPKYCLPYVIGQIKLNHRLWFRSALIRAIHFCSNYLDFLQEQNYLTITCLTNGYSRHFVDSELEYFYVRFNADKIRFSFDQNVYEQLRRRCFHFISEQHTQIYKKQDLEDQEYYFYFSYSYDYGSCANFNKKFHQFWSHYLKDDAQLSHKDGKVYLNPKQIYSSNTLYAQEKPSDELYRTLSNKTYH